MSDRPMTDRDRLGIAVWRAFSASNGLDPAGYVPINRALDEFWMAARREGYRAGVEAAARECDTATTDCGIGPLFNSGFATATEFCAGRIRALLDAPPEAPTKPDETDGRKA